MDRYQCQECLGYFEEIETIQPILCKGCLDKAAGYDIADLDCIYLIKTLKQLLESFKNASTDNEKLNALAEAKGTICVALNYIKKENKVTRWQ